ncbi:TRAF-interacting protein with FHA domain-containing protein A [Dunckerocampus dactyliophorus]|uniref:TRAF-interacting protein with FHA domain-containing protein A n=1 Tax=Dunckerocampus dactyliophorus TaxID=161453 RepID=UPI0024056F3E|nr:TRAF-interacting protein with FHA domain-containing protein A [Dunckerocampus dactyliophorus]XP_054656276.1 TRAF-interacting protein with FHA domain-containing protein A [Dunckerocampus dactyliophorus]
MSVSETMETEEDLLTCLHIKFYHPQQNTKGFYSLLHLGNRSKHCADEPLRLGRDTQVCNFSLVDRRVSRKQLALHAYRTPQSQDMLFTLQNLSQVAKVYVNSLALDFLERVDLPNKALVRFGQYEILIVREAGEAKGSFEVELDVLPAPPSRETCACQPSTVPVMDTGSQLIPKPEIQDPLETDETLMCHSLNTLPSL